MNAEIINKLQPIDVKIKFAWTRSEIKLKSNVLHIYIADLFMSDDTEITREQFKNLVKRLKNAGTDIFTDGEDFYTVRGLDKRYSIVRIDHEFLKRLKEN